MPKACWRSFPSLKKGCWTSKGSRTCSSSGRSTNPTASRFLASLQPTTGRMVFSQLDHRGGPIQLVSAWSSFSAETARVCTFARLICSTALRSSTSNLTCPAFQQISLSEAGWRKRKHDDRTNKDNADAAPKLEIHNCVVGHLGLSNRYS